MDATSTERTNLLGLTRPSLEAFVAQLGSKPFRARQMKPDQTPALHLLRPAP